MCRQKHLMKLKIPSVTVIEFARCTNYSRNIISSSEQINPFVREYYANLFPFVSSSSWCSKSYPSPYAATPNTPHRPPYRNLCHSLLPLSPFPALTLIVWCWCWLVCSPTSLPSKPDLQVKPTLRPAAISIIAANRLLFSRSWFESFEFSWWM